MVSTAEMSHIAPHTMDTSYQGASLNKLSVFTGMVAHPSTSARCFVSRNHLGTQPERIPSAPMVNQEGTP
ncbi:hypothetical protein JTE90_005845 [Oedothorax gibbosus]|uniref:Uncharacterized protein n=1 Tax=Oedothorax gibbosus TaxID=931172 RepID=A0AAV6V4H6_9ARAC|nr:hypothetical protein JTE90_005845 [Oedothorax gibbosus]